MIHRLYANTTLFFNGLTSLATSKAQPQVENILAFKSQLIKNIQTSIILVWTRIFPTLVIWRKETRREAVPELPVLQPIALQLELCLLTSSPHYGKFYSGDHGRRVPKISKGSPKSESVGQFD
jgi:hypothetical protein